jgi:hypothetical protein
MGGYSLNVRSIGIQGTKLTIIRRTSILHDFSTYRKACDVFLAVCRWLITQSVDTTLAHLLMFAFLLVLNRLRHDIYLESVYI